MGDYNEIARDRSYYSDVLEGGKLIVYCPHCNKEVEAIVEKKDWIQTIEGDYDEETGVHWGNDICDELYYLLKCDECGNHIFAIYEYYEVKELANDSGFRVVEPNELYNHFFKMRDAYIEYKENEDKKNVDKVESLNTQIVKYDNLATNVTSLAAKGKTVVEIFKWVIEILKNVK